jgi:hypothetical protein
MASVLCPYCGSKQTFVNATTCEQCGAEVPRAYIENAKKHPPVWLVTFGTTRHGKSTYIDSLAVTIENLGKLTDGVFHKYLDTKTFDAIREVRREVQEGKLKESTKASMKPEPLLIGINGFLDHEVDTLVIYDLAGEIFDDLTTVGDYAANVKNAETVWFLVSLADLERDREGRRISDLFEAYLAAMEKLRTSPQGRNLLVIYTKADRLSDRLPADVREYLRSDPYCRLKELKRREVTASFDEYDYLQGMRQISQSLEDFTYDEVEGGAAFINMIKANKMKLSFAITSSLGQDASEGRQMGTEFLRYRVIDPLIWSLTLNETRKGERQVALLLDSGPGSEIIHHNELGGAFYEALFAQSADVVTYYLGTRQPAFQMGQKPNGAPSRLRPRLVGPILDQLGKQDYALALVTQPISDLNDYLYSSWHDRLMVISIGQDNVQWSHKTVYQPNKTDLYDLVSEFMRLIGPITP